MNALSNYTGGFPISELKYRNLFGRLFVINVPRIKEHFESISLINFNSKAAFVSKIRILTKAQNE